MPNSIHKQARSALAALGLSNLEAEAYISLATRGPSSGYRVAKILGKADANVYKALSSLVARGMVLLETAGRYKTFAALGFAEFGEASKRKLSKRIEVANRSIAALTLAKPAFWKLYHLTSADQIVQRARVMLRKARFTLLVDASPEAMATLGTGFERAAGRGVAVFGKVYKPTSLKGVNVFLPTDAAEVLARWPARWLHIVADGAQTLLCIFSDARPWLVHQAIWSQSPYIAWVLHCAIWNEAAMAKLAQIARHDSKITLARAINEKAGSVLLPTGYHDIMKNMIAEIIS